MKLLLSSVAIVASLMLVPDISRAATIVNFAWTGSAGYSAVGSFSYDAALTPTSFSELPGAGPAQYVQSFSISFFDPANQLLETGSSIVNSVSSDRFFRLDFNSGTNSFTALDADIGGSSYLYFLTNLRTPGGMVVGPGVTDFNLFERSTGTPILDSASSVRVTSISQTPEPATFWLFAVVGALGLCTFRLRHKRFADKVFGIETP